MDNLVTGLSILAVIGFVIAYGKVQKKSAFRLVEKESWKKRYKDSQESHRVTKDELSKYKRDQKKMVENKRKDLANDGVDLGELQQDTPWSE